VDTHRRLSGFCQSVLIALWPLLAVAATYRVVTGLNLRKASGLFISIALFSNLTFAVSYAPPRSVLKDRRTTRPAIEILWGFAAFVLLLWLVSAAPTSLSFTVILWLFAAAGVEELIFRAFLPQQLAQRLRHYAFSERQALVIGCIVVQLSFALCHFSRGNWSFFELPMTEFARLFAAGLLYAEIIALVGFGTAVAIHACTNFLSHGLMPSPIHVGLPLICVFAAIGLIHLWFRATRKASTLHHAGRP